jgi:hypothetical protein
MNPNEIFLQSAPGRGPQPLEMFVRSEGTNEHHFYAQGLTLADFGNVFGGEIRPLDTLTFRMPPDLLNPNYWEPLTKENESAVREKMSGIVTKTEGERVFLWRSDRVARSRILRDGIDAPVELLHGYVFRAKGEDFLKLGAAWNGRGRLEAAGLSERLDVEAAPETLSAVHSDLSRGGLSQPGEAFLYAAQGDGLTRVIFPRAAQLRRAIEAHLRGFVHGVVRRHVGHITGRAIDQLARIADGVGLSATEREVVDKGRTIEIHAWLGRTPWGVSLKPGHSPLAGDERILIYYDAIAGLWAVST